MEALPLLWMGKTLELTYRHSFLFLPPGVRRPKRQRFARRSQLFGNVIDEGQEAANSGGAAAV